MSKLVRAVSERKREVDPSDASDGDAALANAARLAEIFKDIEPEPFAIPENGLFESPPAYIEHIFQSENNA